MINHPGYPVALDGKTKYELKTLKLVPTEAGKVDLGLENGDIAMITGPEALAQTLERAIQKAAPADGAAAEAAMKAAAKGIAENLEEISALRSEEDGSAVEIDFVAVGYGKYRKRLPVAGPVGTHALEKVAP